MIAWLRNLQSRIWARLLVLNLLVVLVPIAGMEFAHIFERTLLDSLQQDMQHQAILTARMVEEKLVHGGLLNDPAIPVILRRAAQTTRMRIRILNRTGSVTVDSHVDGPPEGREPGPPRRWGSVDITSRRSASRGLSSSEQPAWPQLMDRQEIRDALDGNPSAYTRIRHRPPAVFLFVTEPIRHDGHVTGLVYVVRSTTPVLFELYRIRSGLYSILAITLALAFFITLLLALSISRPLNRLARRANRIAGGEHDLKIPIEGSGEVRELATAFAAMTDRLDERLRYISDFAADVAHEFKSPLTSIRGAAELLSEGAADDLVTRERFLKNIELDCARLNRLVSRLLELSRIEASVEIKTTVDLEELVHRATQSIGVTEVSINIDYQSATRLVPARSADLETAIRNLIENAVRFSKPGDIILIQVQSVEAFLEITVQDSGPGIPEANRERIFDRFFTTDADRHGTGLGLAIVRTVAESHGGSVSAENVESGGARLRIRIAAN